MIKVWQGRLPACLGLIFVSTFKLWKEELKQGWKARSGYGGRKDSDNLNFLPGNVVRPKPLSVSVFYYRCWELPKHCLAFVRMVISGGQCCMAQMPGVNMPRAVCLPLSGCVALERHSSLTLSSICKMGLTIQGGKTGVWWGVQVSDMPGYVDSSAHTLWVTWFLISHSSASECSYLSHSIKPSPST